MSSLQDGSTLRRLTADDAMTAALARNWWAIGLRGLGAILFGVLALLLPGVTLSALVLLFAVYMLIDGVFAIVAGVRTARRQGRWGLLIWEGIVDFVAGVIALVAPVATILAFVFLLAAWSWSPGSR